MSKYPHCGSTIVVRKGIARSGMPKFKCGECDRLFQEGVKHSPVWTPEEDELLLKLGQSPNLEQLWNGHARINKWPSRTHKALVARLLRLGSSRYEQGNGWLSRSQLLKTLGMSEASAFSFSNWVAHGLPVYKDDAGFHRVFLGDFVRWCLSPRGVDIAAKFISKNKSVASWFLAAVIEWQNEPNPLQEKPRKVR